MSQGTDISKYFKDSIGIRDNEGRLYICHLVHSWNINGYEDMDAKISICFSSVAEKLSTSFSVNSRECSVRMGVLYTERIENVVCGGISRNQFL